MERLQRRRARRPEKSDVRSRAPGIETTLPVWFRDESGGVALTRREREVLRLVCLRLTDPEIAGRLCIGTRTVESHVASILRKLDAANRREAAIAAQVHGLA